MVWPDPIAWRVSVGSTGLPRTSRTAAYAAVGGDWRPTRWSPACLGPRIALDEVDNRIVTQLAQHPGRVRQDPRRGGLISAGKVHSIAPNMAEEWVPFSP